MDGADRGLASGHSPTVDLQVNGTERRAWPSLPTDSDPANDTSAALPWIRSRARRFAILDVIASAPPIRVFLCHASPDKEAVRQLYRRLTADGFAPWLDDEDLQPGQDWRLAITKAVREVDFFVVCLTRASTSRTGYVHREIKDALDAADEQPEGAIFVIPARLEECEVPYRLAHLHWVDLYEQEGYSRLVSALLTENADGELTPALVGDASLVYVDFHVVDRPDVHAQVLEIFGLFDISVRSMVQTGPSHAARLAIKAYATKAGFERALESFSRLEVVTSEPRVAWGDEWLSPPSAWS